MRAGAAPSWAGRRLLQLLAAASAVLRVSAEGTTPDSAGAKAGAYDPKDGLSDKWRRWLLSSTSSLPPPLPSSSSSEGLSGRASRILPDPNVVVDHNDKAASVKRFLGEQPRAEHSSASSSSSSRAPNRNLIYNGKPTGGNKYPFLVSMWIAESWDGPLLSPPYCHGVMVTDDVFITHPVCISTLEVFPLVMVGDYDSSKPFSASAQLLEVEYVARLSSVVGFGLLTEPVTFEGFAPATLSGEAEAPLEGENLTFVGYSGELLPLGYEPEWNATGWPGPALEAPMWNFDYEYCSEVLGRNDMLCALPLSYIDGTSVPAFPCADDLGGPVLDASNNLLGFTHYTGCDVVVDGPVVLVRRSFLIKSAVERTACQMSRSANPPFPCADVTCPVDAIKFGYPWIEMPDRTPFVRVRNGFDPMSVTQFPPPGAIQRFDSTVNYTITGMDASNRTKTCMAAVIVPPLTPCGTVQLNVTGVGSSRMWAPFVQYPNSPISIATVYKVKGILQSRLRGKGSVTARLVMGGDRLNGAITFKGNRTKGALNNLRVTANFNFLNVSKALQVDLEVRGNTNPGRNLARFDVYCQAALA